MQKRIEATLTRDRFNKPLVVIESPLGNGMEASPAQLRALADVLCRIADEADARPTTGRHFVPVKIARQID